jgi:hypothetical protein
MVCFSSRVITSLMAVRGSTALPVRTVPPPISTRARLMEISIAAQPRISPAMMMIGQGSARPA